MYIYLDYLEPFQISERFAMLFSMIFLFNVLAQKQRKNDLIEAKQIAHLNRSIFLTVPCTALTWKITNTKYSKFHILHFTV